MKLSIPQVKQRVNKALFVVSGLLVSVMTFGLTATTHADSYYNNSYGYSNYGGYGRGYDSSYNYDNYGGYGGYGGYGNYNSRHCRWYWDNDRCCWRYSYDY